ncbi:hypothetical protein [Bradyrhizobium sp. HKCCYLS2038]|uniref:hypothetical protein n=1 Tax=Bradyrhizobium sp. HKCCYLS2038 TaxID=3420764 RepID=UPI003EBE8A34
MMTRRAEDRVACAAAGRLEVGHERAGDFGRQLDRRRPSVPPPMPQLELGQRLVDVVKIGRTDRSRLGLEEAAIADRTRGGQPPDNGIRLDYWSRAGPDRLRRLLRELPQCSIYTSIALPN